MFEFKMRFAKKKGKSKGKSKPKNDSKEKRTKVIKVNDIQHDTVGAMRSVFSELRLAMCVFSKVIITLFLDNGKELSYNFIDSFTCFDEEYTYYTVLAKKKYKKVELRVKYFQKEGGNLKDRTYIFTEKGSDAKDFEK